jgi:hypothetical protein
MRTMLLPFVLGLGVMIAVLAIIVIACRVSGLQIEPPGMVFAVILSMGLGTTSAITSILHFWKDL